MRTAQTFRIFCVIATCVVLSGPVMGIKVIQSLLRLEDDGEGISGAKLIDDRVVNISDVTFCIRFNFKILGNWEEKSQLIHIEDWREKAGDSNQLLLTFGANYPHSFFGFGYPKKEGSYRSFVVREPETEEYEVWATNRWSHVCLAYQSSNGLVRLVKDGKVTNVDYSGEAGLPKLVIPSGFLNKTYLGRCAFDYKMACSSPEGQITDFNIWDRSLTEEEAIAWTSCWKLTKGNLVNWETSKLQLLNMTEFDVEMESVCVPIRPGHVIMPMRRNFSTHVSICHKFKGKVSVIRDNRTQEIMNEEMRKYVACGNPDDSFSGRYWAGWHDLGSEGTFVDVNTRAPFDLKYKPWYLGEPNGDTLENCAMVWIKRNAWNDVSCDEPKCSFCELEQAPDIQIRGLCKGSLFDTKYSWTREMISGRHSFRGYRGTMLQYNQTAGNWVLIPHKGDGSVIAFTEGEEYPFGDLTWTIKGDTCSDTNVSISSLSINACNLTEFNCLDGSCIAIDQRCDAHVDCPDKSDEFGCHILTTDRSYLKDVPPPALPGKTLAGVNISVTIKQVLEIEEVHNTISLQSELKLSWFDSRLIFNNLKEQKNLNTMIPKYRDQIWIPEVVFHNTKAKQESLDDEKAFVTVERKGPFKQSPQSELQNSYIFKGADNPIAITRIYETEFLCEFNMAMFPFDTQECFMLFTMKGNTNNFAEIIGSYLKYNGPTDLTQYFIKNVTMEDNVVLDDKKALSIKIVFGRRIIATVLTTYLPTILLCIVCFSTNYFKPFFFEAVVTVNLTSLLCLITLFLSVFNSLPTTSYIKMIDIWLIFNLLVPFSEVLLHTYIDSLRVEENRDVNHHGTSVSFDTLPPIEINSIVRPKKVKNKVSARDSRDIKMVARDEIAEINARKDFYQQAKTSSNRRLNFAKRFMKFGLPLIFFLFTVVYFIIGFAHYHSK